MIDAFLSKSKHYAKNDTPQESEGDVKQLIGADRSARRQRCIDKVNIGGLQACRNGRVLEPLQQTLVELLIAFKLALQNIVLYQ